MALVLPSLLAANFINLEQELKRINNAKILHYDVMDGHFVPNISFGPAILANIKQNTNQEISVHLMISDPKRYFIEYVKSGADTIIFHFECFKNEIEIEQMICDVKKNNVKVGIAISPKTSIELVLKFLSKVNTLLIMSVEPGFGGQKFMVESLNKIDTAKKYIISNSLNTKIEVDGGIDFEIASRLVDHSVDYIVMGTALFKDLKPKKIIDEIQNLTN